MICYAGPIEVGVVRVQGAADVVISRALGTEAHTEIGGMFERVTAPWTVGLPKELCYRASQNAVAAATSDAARAARFHGTGKGPW